MTTKAVLVTGASTGIGRSTTEWLAAHGYFVFAGARKKADLHALDSINNVQPLCLDVTQAAQIETAAQIVHKSGHALIGLVNNAGILSAGAVTQSSDSELDLVIRTNAHGPFLVVRAFAPMIAAAGGRIVMVGSVAGIVASRNVSTYCMSKHAIEALADSLSLEMEAVGVKVSVIEPSSFNTEIGRKAHARGAGDAVLPDFSSCAGPQAVIAAIAHALFEPIPKRRYLVVSSEDIARTVLRGHIARLVQLNEGHAFTFDKATLVQMLDEALLHARPRLR